MKITTNQFSLTRNDYFQILLFSVFPGRWFVFLLFLLISAIGMKMTTESIMAHTIFFVFVCLVYSIYLLALCAIRAWVLKGGQFLFGSRTCEIDHEFITTYLPDGSLIKINFSDISKTVLRKKYCLFYYSRGQFIYLLLEAMSNPTDLQALMTLIKVKSG